MLKLVYQQIALYNFSNKAIAARIVKAMPSFHAGDERSVSASVNAMFEEEQKNSLEKIKHQSEQVGLTINVVPFKAKPPIDWIEENLVIANSNMSGKYRFSQTPYFRLIVNDFFLPETREIHIKSSAQVGKTQFIASLICYLIYNDPAPILFVTANDDLVEDFSKLRLMRTLKESGLSNIVIPGSNTIHLKSFPNGFIFLTTPISEKNLISRSFKYVFCDEVSKWENQSAMSLLRSRIKTFPLAKIMTLGDPGVRDVCFMNDLYHSGDQNRYHIKCPGCSSWVPLVFKNLLFKKIKGEAKKPHYACPKCHHLITEVQKSHLLKTGKFFPSSANASPGVRSYHLSEMISLLSNWSNVLLEWQRSKDDPLALKVFLNLGFGRSLG